MKMILFISTVLAMATSSAMAGAPTSSSFEWTPYALAQSYQVQRATGNGSFAVVATVTNKTQRYQDTSGTAAGTVYTYQIGTVVGGQVQYNKTPMSTMFGISTGLNTKGQPVTTSTMWRVPGNGKGGVAVAQWNNVTGTSLSSIPTSTTPSAGSLITSLNIAPTGATNYGRYIRGYITAPTAGKYTFFISGASAASFGLSSNNKPGFAPVVAYVNSPTSYQQWNKFSTQKSAPINLGKNQPYYFEVLQKQGTGSDHVSVGWSTATNPTAPSAIIPGTALTSY